VVLLPGWASPAYVFRDLLPALAARGYRAIAVEPRGHGLSDIPSDRASYTADALARHVVQIVEALDLDSVVIGGHSLGAAHAVRATPLLGGRVRAQLLLSPVGTHGQPRRLLVGLLPTRLLRPVAPWLVRRMVVRVVLRMAAARSGVYGPGDIDEYWAPSQFPAFGRAMLDLLTELDWGDDNPVLAEAISVPTLVVYGMRDPLVRRTGAAIHLARSPLVTTVALPGVGHVVTDEAPVAVADAVLEFLATLP
jgi:pimeloyl-ACP methyl ester carboxylesterase